MSMEKTKITFNQFVEKFPTFELPLTIREDSHHEFSRQNDVLPEAMIQQFILPIEVEEQDEHTEYIACFQVPETHGFIALVYWKATLLNYQYTLATFTKKGILIDKRVIAGTFAVGDTLTQSVATIDDDWIILIVSGQSNSDQSDFNASDSTVNKLELLPDGRIVNYVEPTDN